MPLAREGSIRADRVGKDRLIRALNQGLGTLASSTVLNRSPSRPQPFTLPIPERPKPFHPPLGYVSVLNRPKPFTLPSQTASPSRYLRIPNRPGPFSPLYWPFCWLLEYPFGGHFSGHFTGSLNTLLGANLMVILRPPEFPFGTTFVGTPVPILMVSLLVT